jgi:uncharacterized protein (TIGR01244 family)
MADIRQVTKDFAVAPQLALEDFADLRTKGFKRVINNRPDGEAPDQPSSAEVEAAVTAAGLTYVHAPFVGQPTAEAVRAALQAREKTLAFCRSGTRSVTAWAYAEASEGIDAQHIVEAAADVGYNLAPLTRLLKQLGAK